MSEIKALEKLRKLKGEVVDYRWGVDFDRAVDALEAEIADRFMELPVDADGVPIHVGEEMTCHGDVFTVCAVAPAKIHRWVTVKLGETLTTYSYDPMECTHYNPRTIEDVLRDCGKAYHAHMVDNYMNYDGTDEPLIAKYADEMRELMEAGE